MLVQHILAEKSSAKVLTISPDAAISDAADMLSTHKIGALIVSQPGESVLGILSERDIVREIGRSGGRCLTQRVSDLMTSKIVSTHKGDTAENVLATMTAGRFRHMPVMDGDKIISVISIGDVVSARLAEVAREKEAMQSMIMGH